MSARRVATEVAAIGVPLAAVLLSHPTQYAFAAPAAIVACALLPLRHVRPWLAVLACLPALLGGLGWPPSVVALYRLGRDTSSVKKVAAWVAASFLALVLPIHLSPTIPLPDRLMSLGFSLVALGGPAAMGVLVRLRSELSATVQALQAARRAEADERDRRARADERTRIAREIHDAVGHNTTLIAVQAAALATVNPSARETADHIRALAKQSLTEMRTALGLDTVDQRGLADIPDLVTRAQSAGLDVAYQGDQPPTTPTVARAAYRVVQEALTNAMKHAPGAPVGIKLERHPTTLTVSITNAPPPHPPGDTPPGGTGLIGLAERVTNAGGTLQAHPLPQGGFTVQAALPTKVDPTHSTSDGGAPHPIQP